MAEMTDDEVLKLALKIKRKRELDEVYKRADEEINKLTFDISEKGAELGENITLRVHTTNPASSRTHIHVEQHEIHMPSEITGPLILFIKTYIEERNAT